MATDYVFIGGVDVSEACLAALCGMGFVPSLAVGYDESRAGASGYRDLGPIARRYGFPLERTVDVNGADLLTRITRLAPSAIFVIGWSQLIRPALLDVPRNGCVGIHPTDLPIGRGRAPIPWTILKGLPVTASTMFFLTPGVDDGDVVGRQHIQVEPRETAASLYAKHRDAHVALIERFGQAVIDGTAPREPQDDALATYWEARRPDDGVIDPQLPVAEVDRLVRAVGRPFPGAFLPAADGSRLIIWAGVPVASSGGEPGEVVQTARGSVLECLDGGLLLVETERVDPQPQATPT